MATKYEDVPPDRTARSIVLCIGHWRDSSPGVLRAVVLKDGGGRQAILNTFISIINKSAIKRIHVQAYGDGNMLQARLGHISNSTPSIGYG
jgi:hypothetical protein